MAQSGTVTANGNPVLDAINGITGVVFSGLDKYSSFLDAQTARNVAKKQASTPAVSAIVVPSNSLLDNPAQIQKTLLYVGLAATLAFGMFYAVKKIA